MFDFSYIDIKLLFPNLTEGWALAIDSFSAFLNFAALVLMVIAEWKLFRKFGEKPWKSLIPFYNTYIMYKHSWSKKAFWTYFIADTLFDICNGVAERLSKSAPDSSWMTILVLIAVPFGIVAAICSVLYAFRLAEAFGKGKIFGVGLVFLYPVFVSIVGFGKSQYIGNCEGAAVVVGTEAPKEEGEAV